ncbi:MAG TPA: hypothetical protein VFO72_07060 [Pyrinomonadaceae bacterium]|nr:hypothetical protein [Pyrinomonadaceae bacterium]
MFFDQRSLPVFVSKHATLGVGGGMVRLKANGEDVVAEAVYFTRGLPNGIGGAVIVGDYLYGTEVGSKLLAVEFATGKVMWESADFGHASVAAADGHLYLHLLKGDYVLVEATPQGFREKGRFMPPNPPKHKQVGTYPEMAFTYPVIANGRLYIPDLGTLWAYDISEKR